MGKRFTPTSEFIAREYDDGSNKSTSELTLVEAIRGKHPRYADNFADRFKSATRHNLEWKYITLPNLDRLVQYLRACGLADNSIRQYGAKLLSVLNIYRDIHPNIPDSKKMASILIIDKDQSYDVYLDDDDLDVLYAHLAYMREHANERQKGFRDTSMESRIMVLTHFLISADTGARSFDERGLSWDNISETYDSAGNPIYVLTYTTNKRGIKAQVPLSKDSRVIPLLKSSTPLNISHRTCNYLIKQICREAGLTRQIKRRHGGKDIVEELCEAVHFHIGRKSFCTNALKRGSSITDVMQFMGHTNPAQTVGYNCAAPTFNAEAIGKQRKAM